MKNALAIAAIGAAAVLAGCSNDADVASQNLSQAADNFRIARRVVFYNGITGEYILDIQGFCALDAGNPKKLMVTCKTPDGYKKHYLGVSDNVTWFAEQLNAANVSTSFYKVTWKPTTILPAVDLR